MSAEPFRRKLAAILSADVKGYSRLMGENEAQTVKTLTTYRKIMAELIQQHRGRVVDSPGDNILSEFGSVVDAVQCAVAVQKEFKARNAELPENRRMEFRIGINLGDVIEEEGRIYGDGVNIAARLEALADPGGICISRTAFDQIETKLPLGYEYLGEQTVKNITKPVGAYKVLMEPRVLPVEKKRRAKEFVFRPRKLAVAGTAVFLVVVIGAAIWNFSFRLPAIEPASRENMAYPLPDKPSIAVLPFANMSGDSKQDYFSDGITEEIITALSKNQKLFVIARNSSFVYKGKSVNVQQVGRELGVKYVLEGSVRRSEDQLRVTAQLIDATTGNHLWAERYDREMKDVFAIQDEVTMKVLLAMQVKLVEGEQAPIRAKGTGKLEAYEKFLQATEYHYRFTREAGAMAAQLCQEAIALDSEYAAAYSLLSVVLLAEVRYGWTKTRAETLQRAVEMAQKALTLDSENLIAQLAMGQIHLLKKEHDQAIAWGERAVATHPNADNANAFLAWFLSYSGRPEDAIPLLKNAIRRNPMPPGWYHTILGNAYRLTGRFEEAATELRKSVARSPDDMLAHMVLTATYAQAGREEEAGTQAAEVMRIQPAFSLDYYERTSAYKDKADTDRFIEALRKAGLK